MAPIKTIVFLFTVLIPATIVLAEHSEETTEALSTTHGDSRPPHSGFNWPTWFLGFSGSRSTGAPGLPASGTSFSESLSEENRKKRAVVRCNFSKLGNLSCRSCHQVLRCYPMNYGTVTTCSGSTRYCYKGRCSSTQGALCKGTTFTSTSSSSSSTSTSTTQSTSTSTSSSSSSTSSSTSSCSSTSDSTTASTTSSSSQAST